MEAKDTVKEVSEELASRVPFPTEGMIRKEKEAQAEISFKAGAMAMYKLIMDETYTVVQFHQSKYAEFKEKQAELIL